MLYSLQSAIEMNNSIFSAIAYPRYTTKHGKSFLLSAPKDEAVEFEPFLDFFPSDVRKELEDRKKEMISEYQYIISRCKHNDELLDSFCDIQNQMEQLRDISEEISEQANRLSRLIEKNSYFMDKICSLMEIFSSAETDQIKESVARYKEMLQDVLQMAKKFDFGFHEFAEQENGEIILNQRG